MKSATAGSPHITLSAVLHLFKSVILVNYLGPPSGVLIRPNQITVISYTLNKMSPSKLSENVWVIIIFNSEEGFIMV